MTAKKLWVHIMLLLTIMSSFLIFGFGWRYDNKYTRPGPQGRNGVLSLMPSTLEETPFFYLIDGWEIYRQKLLSPADLASGNHLPDEYVFIGQYGGFESRDGSSSPHGGATYRLNIFTDDTARPYALELPEIHSAYRLWVNGQLLASDSTMAPPGFRSASGTSLLIFTAAQKIELVIQAADSSHLYSGMTFPPAFGTPKAVEGLLNRQALSHMIACSLAIIIGIFYLAAATSLGQFKMALPFTGLCLCYAIMTAYPILHVLGLHNSFLDIAQSVSLYALFVCLFALLEHICNVSQFVVRMTVGWGGAVCVLVVVFPLWLMGDNLFAMLLYSRFLLLYKWGASFFLLICAARYAFRGHIRSQIMLAGFCVFACALITDRLHPLYEPVYGGWPTELASFILVILVSWVLVLEIDEFIRETRSLEERERSSEQLLEMQKDQYSALSQHFDQVRTLKHEMRSHLAALEVYCQTREYGKLNTYLEDLLEENNTLEQDALTSNDLVNAILNSRFYRAEQAGIRVTREISQIPTALSLSDKDLCSLLTNILDNAIDACARIPEGGERWIDFQMYMKQHHLKISCKNSKYGEIRTNNNRFFTSKSNPEAHGYGIELIRRIAEKYDGIVKIQFDDTTFLLGVAVYAETSS